MRFKISVSTGHPVYDSLPAAGITCFHHPVPEDYRPFSQGRLFFGQEGFYLQLISFEVKVSAQSRLRAAFSADGKKYFSLVIGEAGLDEFSLWEGESLLWRDDEAAEAAPIHGEDLQGEYWGGQALVPYETLARIWPEFSFAAGKTIRGNLYKYCGDPEWRHWGSFYPVAENAKNPFGTEGFGEFELVAY